MGRKIPGKKHHGVKDPEKQQKARLDKVKMKVSIALLIMIFSIKIFSIRSMHALPKRTFRIYQNH